MTYTATENDSNAWGFFVIGGNLTGTESGRIYVARLHKSDSKFYTIDRVDFPNADKQALLNVTNWVTNTILSWDTSSTADIVNTTQWGGITLTDADGSILYDGVQIL